MRKLFFILYISLFFQCSNSTTSDERIIGVKIYEHQGNVNLLIEEWKSMGINTAFVSKELLSDQHFREATINNHIKTFVILPIFFDEEALTKNPDLYAIQSNGAKAIDEWVKFVCPSNPDYREEKIASIVDLIKKSQPDGLSIDFIRHFVFWEKVYPQIPAEDLPNTCFDARCLDGFQKHTKIKLPDTLAETTQKSAWILEHHGEAWANWKCELISSVVQEIIEKAREVDPELLFNAHIVPWRQNDFEGAIRKIAGQDIVEISRFTDYLSPMTYSHMVKQNASWVHEVVQDIFNQTEKKILPSIQVKEAYLSDSLSTQEFELNLESALKSPSKGVVFWSWEHLNLDPWKKEIIRKHVH